MSEKQPQNTEMKRLSSEVRLALVGQPLDPLCGVRGRLRAAGVGTAMVYPTSLASIGDVALPSWRASAVGVYRLWWDLGYAIGAVVAGVAADAIGLVGAMWLVAGITLMSGVIAAVRMDETAQFSTA
jgi:MFS family permease